MKTLAAMLLCASVLVIAAAPAEAASSSNASSATSQPTQRMAHKATAPRQRGRTIDNEYTAALNSLVARGYTGIADITKNGKTFDASVMQQGRRIVVSIDPSTGQIQERG
jgi:hypothetical protein